MEDTRYGLDTRERSQDIMTKQMELAKLEKQLNEKEEWIRSQINTPEMFRRIGFLSQARDLEDKIKWEHREIKRLVEEYKKVQRRTK